MIHVIRKNPGITQTQVCKILGLDKGSVARQTLNLENKGYLVRRENPEDGRSQLLFATEKAQKLKLSKAAVETMFYEWLLEGISERERNEFARILEILYFKCKNESKADFTEMTKKINEFFRNNREKTNKEDQR